jgi:hypothetical protein
MLFSEKYADLSVDNLVGKDGIIRSEYVCMCEACGRPCSFIDVNAEAYVCSEECQEKLGERNIVFY